MGDPSTRSCSRSGSTLARVVLVAWAPVVLLALASLMTSHWAPLPTPERGSTVLAKGLATLRDARDPESPLGWTLWHVLYEDCRCSRRVVEQLQDRARQKHVHERCILVRSSDEQLDETARGNGGELELLLRGHGVPCHLLSNTELERLLGIRAAPLFIVCDDEQRVRHVGGYTDRKQGLALHDRETVARLRAGEEVSSRPVFGCGVASELQDALDPLGIKY
ncbi:MAG: hypothetical protein AB8H80_17905 [Planctomycetota bacterium]